jgi:carboxypeptidase Q
MLIFQTRGKEWAEMLTPRKKSLSILSLGSSVGTDGKVITAQVIVVKTFDELSNRSNEIKGKIVVYNFDFQSYGQQVQYRSTGASEAAKYGAVAALVMNFIAF